MKLLFSTISLTIMMSAAAMAADIPTSKSEYCERIKTRTYAQDVLLSERNQISFQNQGGIGGGGVCWWHSMFTRNAAYLTVFKPELPRPDKEEIKGIISDIKNKRGVVEIPGYRDLAEFSRDNGDEILKTLESWQVEDGAFGFGWIRGLKGKPEVKASKLKSMMDELYHLVNTEKRVIYQKLQMPGITAHAWIVAKMEKTDDGYVLTTVDSNFPLEVLKYQYRNGDTKLDYFGNTTFVPYTSRSNDEKKFASAQRDYCVKGITAKQIRKEAEERRCQSQSGRNSRRCQKG